MRTREILEEARGLIDEPEKWCQHFLHSSGQYCALGAIKVASGLDAFWCAREENCDDFQNATFAVAQVINPGTTGGHTMVISQYNNSHDHACVIEAFDAAIEQCSD